MRLSANLAVGPRKRSAYGRRLARDSWDLQIAYRGLDGSWTAPVTVSGPRGVSAETLRLREVKTNDSGVFKTRIFAPDKGRWKWRSKVDHSNGFGNTKGKVWTLYFD